MTMTEGSSEKSIQNVLLRILHAASKGTMYTAAALSIIALLPGVLSLLASGIGSGIMGDLIGRLANGEKITPDEMKQQIESALKKSRLLEKDDFWHAIEQLRKGQQILSQQNKAIYSLLQEVTNIEQQTNLTIVDGSHSAEGVGNVTGLDIQEAVIIKPGTKSTAKGIGNITATRIGGNKEKGNG
jgi:flagellar biosynthesis component FlhA